LIASCLLTCAVFVTPLSVSFLAGFEKIVVSLRTDHNRRFDALAIGSLELGVTHNDYTTIWIRDHPIAGFNVVLEAFLSVKLGNTIELYRLDLDRLTYKFSH